MKISGAVSRAVVGLILAGGLLLSAATFWMTTAWIHLGFGLLMTAGIVTYLMLEQHRRRRAEAEVAARTLDLSSAMNRLQTLIDASPVAIVVYDSENQVTLWSRATEQLTGYSMEEVLGRTLPAGLSDALKSIEDELEAMACGEVVHGIEVESRRKDDTLFQIVASMAGLVDASGKPQGFIIAALDITERRRLHAMLRQTETLLSTIVSSSDDAMISKTLNGVVTSWNQGAERIFGYSAAEMIGQPIATLAIPGCEEEVVGVLERILRGERVDHYETQRRRKDGATLDISLSVSPICNAEGRIVGASKIARDISATKAAERHRQQLSAQLYQAQKMEAIGALTGGMAHDFNNLLSVIWGNLDLLAQVVEPGSDRDGFVQAALEATVKGADLIRRLLALARRQPLAPQLTQIAATLKGMGELLHRTLGRDIQLTVTLVDDLWPVMIDVVQLESALLNLAVNSRHAMHAGGILTIEAKNLTLDDWMAESNLEAPPGDYLVLSVSDTGSGISAETLARVFEPFFTTKGVGGSGLGLSMVHGFIRQSGGDIRIYSEVGFGTTVRIYLPRAYYGGEKEGAVAGLAIKPTGGHELILVVEDDADVREVTIRGLHELGYRTIPARDGVEGLAIVRGGAALDLLFIDMVMPGGMNGSELADAALRLRPDLKVLFTSGFTAAAASAAMQERKFGSNLLTKPYRKAELAQRVRATLDNPA